jgi:hypothetical protein
LGIARHEGKFLHIQRKAFHCSFRALVFVRRPNKMRES